MFSLILLGILIIFGFLNVASEWSKQRRRKAKEFSRRNGQTQVSIVENLERVKACKDKKKMCDLQIGSLPTNADHFNSKQLSRGIFVNTVKQLETLGQELQGLPKDSAWVGVDIEHSKNHTYYGIICLI